jgi:H+-translocating NAD(P) transhydrogenase subunit alpha
MDQKSVADAVENLAKEQDRLASFAHAIAQQASDVATTAAGHGGGDFFLTGLTVFVLACFVGYYVVWRVTPALHSPLMAVTNAISSVIIVGALIAAGPSEGGVSSWLGNAAALLAAINIFGGFVVTQRMLAMYKKKQPTEGKKHS